jgi:hypothetical protein
MILQVYKRYTFLWLPSHIGCNCVSLQPQKNTFFDSLALYFTGENPVCLWDPSQNGCDALSPQLHQKYDLPDSTSTV